MKVLLDHIKAFFFDFDGVLVDSVEVKAKAFGRLFAPFGPAIEAKVMVHHRLHGGMTRKEKFRYYYAEYLHKPCDEQELQRLNDNFSTLVIDDIVAAPEIPGAMDFLRNWHERVTCFIVSAVPDAELHEIVDRRGLAPFFREVLGAAHTKVENLGYLFNRYGFNPEATIFFGDAEADWRAAQSHGVPFIGILPGADAPLLRLAPEIRWVHDFRELASQGFLQNN